MSPRLSGECSPPHLYNVEAELSEGGDEIEFLGSEDESHQQQHNNHHHHSNHTEELDETAEDPREEEDSSIAATPEPVVTRGAPHHPHAILAASLGHKLPQPVVELSSRARQQQHQLQQHLARRRMDGAGMGTGGGVGDSSGGGLAAQQYCLRWKYHHNNLQVMFSQLLERESFCDVTLASEGRLLRAHKVVLSACSTYFDQIFSQYEEKNPIVILKDVKYDDIKALVEFMYRGEINVEQSHLASLLKTAEELKVKGLAEVSWRAEEAQAAANAMADEAAAAHMRGAEEEEPAYKRMKRASMPPSRPSHTPPAQQFKPRVTSVSGAVGTKDAFVLKKSVTSPYVDISMEEGQMANDSMGSDYEMEQPDMEQEDSMQSNASLRDGGSERGGNGAGSDGKPAGSGSSPIMDERTRELFKGVVKMNDYLVTGRRQQFWEEPFMRRLMDAIKNKEVEMKLVAEVLGVSYGTLYGRYRDTHGCLKHPYRLRDFWNEPGPSEVIMRLRNKELTLNEAADMLNVSMNTLTSYVASMPTSIIDKAGESSAAFAAAARLPPDITATPHRKVKEEPDHSEMGNGNDQGELQ
ncbi:hypothetical protein B566_EDAN002065 [Ephemera danica]|nr:hypothetical protein B566_EDAN002065 [Ephemera danica]